MAAASADLLSLLNNLEDIHHHRLHPFSFDSSQIQSLLETVDFSIDFMESYGKSQRLQRRITCAARAAEAVIEAHIVDEVLARSTLTRETTSRFLPDPQRVIAAMDFANRETSASSSAPLIFEKNTVVGFGDALLQILDLLFREPSSLQVVNTIIFMGGIGFSGLDGLPSIYCSVSSAISTVRMPVEQEGQGNEDLQLELSILDAKEKEESFNKR